MICKGPKSMKRWKETANWRNDELTDIARSKNFNNILPVADYFVTTIGAKWREANGDCTHISKRRMGGHSGVLAKWLEVLGNKLL